MSDRPFQIGDKVRKLTNAGENSALDKPIYTVTECFADGGYRSGWAVSAKIDECECCRRGSVEINRYDSAWFVAVP